MKLRFLLFMVTQLIFSMTYGQDMMYYHKISEITGNRKSATELYKKLDSLKRTRRPNDSNIEIYFDRDIDFGYRHQRINLELNSFSYKINLLTKNDTIYLSSIKFDDTFYDAHKKLNAIKTDTIHALSYLKSRNEFYGSSKTLNDLKNDLNLNEVFAFYCGDGSPKTKKGFYIEKLAKSKQANKLTELIQNINCEQQAYGEAGFALLKSAGIKISQDNEKILTYIKNRKTTLVECSGCLILVNSK
jgi:hypothetical protein